MTEEITKQLEFVQWLKDNDLYNTYDSAISMRKMQAVWEVSCKYEKCLQEALEHQVSNLGIEGKEFYTCYTYKHGVMPDWVIKAKELLK